MRRMIAALTIAAALLAPGAAAGKVRLQIAKPDIRGFDAEVALINQIQSFGITQGRVDEGVCQPHKRNRWRCIVDVTLPDQACRATVVVTRHAWRFPTALFGCPAEWRPAG